MSDQTVDLLNALLKILNWDQRKIDNVTALINSLGTLGDKEPIANSLNQDNSTLPSSSVSESDLIKSCKQIETSNQEKEKLEFDLRKRIVQLEAEKEKLESDLSNRSEQLEASNQQKCKLESELGKRIDQLETEKKNLESDLSNRSEQLEATNQEKEKLESDLRKRIVQLEAEKKNLESDLSNRSEQLEAANQQKDKLESDLGKRIDQLETEKKNLESDLSSRSEQLEAANLQKDKLESDLSKRCKQLEAANHQLQDQNNLITKLTGEKDFLAEEKQKQDKRLEEISDFSRIEEINNFVNGLPISLKNLSCLRILAFDELSVLLTQFGNLQRLKSLWQAVHSEILATNQICDVELIRLLRIMIEYYNRANPGTELSVYEPHIGDKFDANLFSRLAGPFVPSCVSKVLFPGLKNVKGEHWVKPIVC